MKALVLEAAGKSPAIKEVNKPAPGPGEVLVQLKAAALNRRDYWITIGKYAGLKYPVIPGSDGAGVVVETGSEADRHWMGKEVMLYPAENWGDNPAYQAKDFKILGLPDDGTLAEYVKVKTSQLYLKPAYLSWQQAAAFPLAGLTAYRAVFTKARAASGDRVLISGAGSGTGTFALQFAVAAGCQVFVTSGSADKIEKGRRLGAAAGVNYKTQDWAEELRQLSGGFDVIIDSALGEGFSKFPEICNPGGRIVFFGGTAGNVPPLDGRKIFWKQLQLLGTTMGTTEEFKAMLEFIALHQIHPVIDEEFPLSNAPKAIEKLGESAQFGKIIINII